MKCKARISKLGENSVQQTFIFTTKHSDLQLAKLLTLHINDNMKYRKSTLKTGTKPFNKSTVVLSQLE